MVYTKYLKALIDYDGLYRTETFMFPREAFREILLNAVIHKDYSGCNPIQIKVYDDKMYIWNDGVMPAELSSTEKLFQPHSSKPFNPKLAGVFFKSGMIEAWGRGFEKIREACENEGAPLPEYQILSYGVMVHIKPNEHYMRLHNSGTTTKPARNGNVIDPVNSIGGVNSVNSDIDDANYENNVTDNVIDNVSENVIDNVSDKKRDVRQAKLLELLRIDGAITTSKLAKELKVSERTILRDLEALKNVEHIKRIGSDTSGYWQVT